MLLSSSHRRKALCNIVYKLAAIVSYSSCPTGTQKKLSRPLTNEGKAFIINIIAIVLPVEQKKNNA